ncbi:MAG: right-handed parallel beta-helix repeat-containing protein, partial [Thermoplasmata archaeon]|nr:right-handed parallel beta-helix repeat-containing protein [Thermoplasmata archaeon]
MLGTALFAILTVVIALPGDVEAAQEVIDTDWIVNATESGTVDIDYIMRANLTITGTGQISFLRCKFKFMSETPGQYGITVQPGGYLILQSCILEAGFLEPGEQAKAWTFYVKDSGRLSLQASTVMDLGIVGGVDREKGLALETDGAYVVGSTFSDCNRGIIVMSGAAPIIANNTFEGNTVGIEVKGSASSITSFNTFEANVMGMLYSSCPNAF